MRVPRLIAFVSAVALAGTACATSVSPTGVSPTPGPASTPTAAAGGAIPLVIDTDMAPDDITAIASLLRDSRVEVLAITVVGTGEAHCPGGMLVARSVLQMLDAGPIPVTCGRQTPFGDAQPFPDLWRSGADTGNRLRLEQPTSLPDPRAAELLLSDTAQDVAASGRRLTILTLGPLTNVAGALALDPTLPDHIRLVSMLGAVGVPGNVSPDGSAGAAPTAEWNAHADPTAVKLVLDAGFDLTLVALDATNDVPLTQDLFRALETDHAAGPADLVYELWSRNTFMTAGGSYLWDPLASGVVRDPSIVTTRTATLRVVLGAGLDGGRLIEDPAGAVVSVATSADRTAFESLLLAALRLGEPRA